MIINIVAANFVRAFSIFLKRNKFGKREPTTMSNEQQSIHVDCFKMHFKVKVYEKSAKMEANAIRMCNIILLTLKERMML